MDWQRVISRNHEALLVIIVALMASVGLQNGGTLTTLPHFLYRKALLTLRQAESALRRLIIIAARQMSFRGVKLRKPRLTATNFALLKQHAEPKTPTFNLMDSLKTFGHEASNFDGFELASADTGVNNTPVSAASLGHRLLALKHALGSIPKHAKRLAQWYAKRDLAYQKNQRHRFCPMRPGPAPGAPRIKRTEMEKLLLECHLMAVYARDRPDSS